jgi:hypothetical protein
LPERYGAFGIDMTPYETAVGLRDAGSEPS